MPVVIDEVQAEIAPPEQAAAQSAHERPPEAKSLEPRDVRPVLVHLAKREARVTAD